MTDDEVFASPSVISNSSFSAQRPLNLHRIQLPDLAGVLADRPVAGELAHARGVEDRHFRPAGFVLEGSVYQLLGVTVGLEIGEHEEWVAVDEILVEHAEAA